MSHYGTGFSALTDLRRRRSRQTPESKEQEKMTTCGWMGSAVQVNTIFFPMIVRFYCKSDTQDEPTASKRSAIKLEYEQLNQWKATHKDVHA